MDYYYMIKNIIFYGLYFSLYFYLLLIWYQTLKHILDDDEYMH